MTTLVFDDAQGYADFATFVARARSLDEDGAMRLQADGDVLAAYVGVLPGRGLMGDGAVVGLRMMRLAAPVRLDTTVALASLADRPAGGPRGRRHGSARRAHGHRPGAVGGVDAAAFGLGAGRRARGGRLGARSPATGSPRWRPGRPTGAGAQAVADLRQRVWGRLTETVPPVPAGAAFAAYALGFLDPAVRARWPPTAAGPGSSPRVTCWCAEPAAVAGRDVR